MRDLNGFIHESDIQQRIHKLAQCCFTIVAELEKISRDERLGATRGYFESTLIRVRDEINRLAVENGLPRPGDRPKVSFVVKLKAVLCVTRPHFTS